MDEKEADYRPFMEAIQARIKKNWLPPKTETKSATLAILFVIEPDGKMSSNRIKTSSGNSLMDSKAMDAITHSAPFPEIITMHRTKPLTIDFTFQYRVNDIASQATITNIESPCAETLKAGALVSESNTTYGSYIRDMKTKIKTNWLPPRLYEDATVVSQFTVLRDGSICGLQVTQPASYEPFNNASRYAIRQSAPYAKLPKNYPDEGMLVEITLAYKGKR
jgi:TonB family protein